MISCYDPVRSRGSNPNPNPNPAGLLCLVDTRLTPVTGSAVTRDQGGVPQCELTIDTPGSASRLWLDSGGVAGSAEPPLTPPQAHTPNFWSGTQSQLQGNLKREAAVLRSAPSRIIPDLYMQKSADTFHIQPVHRHVRPYSHTHNTCSSQPIKPYTL